jgi:hypothetical protein
MITYRTPLVLYELPIAALELLVGGNIRLDFSAALGNGRSNYILFQSLISRYTGLAAGSEGAKSDLAEHHEVKAFHDTQLYPEPKWDLFQTSASVTFSANNKGPVVKALVEAGKYAAALQICKETGYDKNDAYIYTNTSGFRVQVPFRYIIVPKSLVLALLDRRDPRLISRAAVLSRAVRRERIDPRSL